MDERGTLFGLGFKKQDGKEEEKEVEKETTFRQNESRVYPTPSLENNDNVDQITAKKQKTGCLDDELAALESTTDLDACGCDICNISSFLDSRWHVMLKEEFKKDYMTKIIKYLHKEKTFYPPIDKVFYFSKFCGPKDVKVVILGQDPYHNPKQATGLAFSVPIAEKIPPSLKNIFTELESNYDNFSAPNHGDLTGWAMQGVLLLNDSLTVRKNAPNSHANIGWQNFTHRIIVTLSSTRSNLVFILWGANAQKKQVLIDKQKHLVLKSPHPSPFSADRGFFGSKHFLKANEYLIRHSLKPIDWRIRSL